MGTPTYTPLAEVTLGSSASSVTFSSIPATYRDLVLVSVPGHSTTFVNFFVRFNSDTGSNYSMVRMSGNGSAASSSTTTATSIDLTFQSDVSTSLGDFMTIANIMDYSTTNKHKTVLSRSNRAGAGTDAFAHRWANTSAITAIEIRPNTGTWRAGSTFALYGIIA